MYVYIPYMRWSYLCFVCACRYVLFAFCGHGEEGILYTSDGKSVEIEGLLDHFNSYYNPNLSGKVRLIFLDACRGDRQDRGLVIQHGGRIERRLVSGRTDILIAYSTLPGYTSQEVLTDRGYQSLWMPVLAEQLFLCNESILNVLVRVNNIMQRKAIEILTNKKCGIHLQVHEVINTLVTPVHLVQDWLRFVKSEHFMIMYELYKGQSVL